MIKPVDVINCISIFQLAYFTAYIFHKGTRTPSNLLLGIFFIVQFLVLVNTVSFNIFGSNERFKMNTAYLTTPICFLWGPLMYFYILSQVYKRFTFQLHHLIHLLPCLISLVYLTVGYFSLPFDLKSNMFQNGLMYRKFNFIGWLMNMQVIGYNFVSLITLIKYQRKIKNHCSSVSNQNLAWLKMVLFGYILACIVSEGLFFFGNRIQISYDLRELMVFTSFLVFFNVLFYKAMIHPHVFIAIDQKTEPNAINLRDEDILNYAQVLDLYMKESKPYLNASLTLKELAQSAHVGERVISQIINQYYKQNFYTYINSFRIEEAKKLIKTSDMDKITMLGIAFDAGFNSKTVFYDTFKKHVGMTPSHYRHSCP